MLVLSLDTTSECGGAAVYDDESPLAVVANPGAANRYSVTLFEMVDRALAQAGVALKDIELYAVARGPGSFTGIRVGLAAVQGWTAAFARPARGVSTLAAMVAAAEPKTPWAVPILSARRGEFFLGHFQRRQPARGQDGFALSGEAEVVSASALEADLRRSVHGETLEAQLSCVVKDSDRAALALRPALGEGVEWQVIESSLVGSIARLALRMDNADPVMASMDLDAFYVRRADAEIGWKG